MCQHCCHKNLTPSASIPYSCPLCPVRQVSGQCSAPNRAAHPKQNRYPTTLRSSRPAKPTKLCQDLSEFYSDVVADKTIAKSLKRRRRRLPVVSTLERPVGGTVRPTYRPTPSAQETVRFGTMNSFGIDTRQYLDINVPLLQKEQRLENGTWTWATPTQPKCNNVLAVPARRIRHGRSAPPFTYAY